MSGPTSVSGSVPRPILSAAILSASPRAKSSAIGSATWKRLAAVHASPTFRIFATIAPSIAASRSASSKTTNGALPPSSIETRSSWLALCSTSLRPTAVDPVNDSLRVRGSRRSGSMSAPAWRLVTTLSTPGGSPARCMMSARASIESGVCWAGLTIIVHPAATAGAILRAPIAIGKFHGVTNTHGPTGWRVVRMRPLPVVLTM